MATLLYRLGRFSFRRPWRVIGVWLVLLVSVLGAGLALGGQLQESYSIPGTESQTALDRLEAVFPQVAGATVDVVVTADDDITEQSIASLLAELERVDGVDTVVSPFSEYAGRAVSDDESMAIVRVQLTGSATDVTQETLDGILATESAAVDAGMRVEYGGQVFQDTSFGITVTEVFGVIFAGLVLIVTFGSLLAAGMPLLGALVGVGVAMGAILGVAAFTPTSSTAPLLALMIGLAVGIDYALFILSRHRTQLALGEDPEESTGVAVGTAGSAVVFAGVTVIIALLGLLVVGIPFLSVMGVAAAFAVLIAIAVAVTLLPALLGLAGSRLTPREGSRAWRRAQPALAEPRASLPELVEGSMPEREGSGASTGSATEVRSATATPRRPLGQRWVRGVMRHPLLATLGVVAVLGVLAVPAASLDLNIPDGGTEPVGSSQREAYDLISEGFGPGFNGPLVVAIDITQTVEFMDDLEEIRHDLEQLDGVAYVSQGLPDAGLDTAIIQVIPGTAPAAPETKELVHDLRELAPQLERDYDTPVWVTGTTAVAIDISNRLTDALVPFALVVVGLSIVLLMMVFRSVLVPIKAALGFLLSVTASIGVVVAVFQWGWGAELLHVEAGPILSFLPIVLIAVLFGLAMDYEVFLVSGMRESFVRHGDPKRAIEEGFSGAARVVTAAALIMFFVFFAFVPEGSGMIKPIALGLALGIAIDAFLVRMTLVPALMSLFGTAAWWMPRWLLRILPDVDVEGERLREHREAVEWAHSRRPAVLSAHELVASVGMPPVTFDVPAGSLVLVTGAVPARRCLGAVLAGRLEAAGGLAHVHGHPTASEADRVRSLVAIADLGDADRLTARDAVGARLEATRPWWRAVRGSAVRTHLDRVERVLGEAIDGSTPLGALAPLPRAVVLAAAALAERTPVIVLDRAEALPDVEEFARAVRALAPADTVIVLGLPHGAGLEHPDLHLDLESSPRALEGLAR